MDWKAIESSAVLSLSALLCPLSCSFLSIHIFVFCLFRFFLSFVFCEEGNWKLCCPLLLVSPWKGLMFQIGGSSVSRKPRLRQPENGIFNPPLDCPWQVGEDPEGPSKRWLIPCLRWQLLLRQWQRQWQWQWQWQVVRDPEGRSKRWLISCLRWLPSPRRLLIKSVGSKLIGSNISRPLIPPSMKPGWNVFSKYSPCGHFITINLKREPHIDVFVRLLFHVSSLPIKISRFLSEFLSFVSLSITPFQAALSLLFVTSEEKYITHPLQILLWHLILISHFDFSENWKYIW